VVSSEKKMDLSYKNLLDHLNHHNVKRWLLNGCDKEGAHTIKEAVERISESRLRRKLAEILQRRESNGER
jgi:hypothetical protein